MRQINAFGIKINPLKKQDFLDIIDEGIKNKKQIVQSGINAASIVELSQSANLTKTYNQCDLINIDGMSLVWALRYFGNDIPERVACPDLAESLLKLAEIRNYGVYFLGAKEAQLQAAITNIQISFPNLRISGYHNGYFKEEDEDSIVQMIDQSKADILLLGLPSPKKEFFVEKNKLHLTSVNYFLGVGGFFDILAGSIKRAPLWMQSVGLEWFYRLLQEPQRLLSRYFIGNLKFTRLVILEKNKLKQLKPRFNINIF
jgi:N-acetylglucosaminyldiphosphoundecaprenol N-acetyl-beta-D-mannosaminyltransferase